MCVCVPYCGNVIVHSFIQFIFIEAQNAEELPWPRGYKKRKKKGGIEKEIERRGRQGQTKSTPIFSFACVCVCSYRSLNPGNHKKKPNHFENII